MATDRRSGRDGPVAAARGKPDYLRASPATEPRHWTSKSSSARTMSDLTNEREFLPGDDLDHPDRADLGPGVLRRRAALKALAAAGVGTATFRRALAAQADKAQNARVTPEMIKQAEWIAGLDLT